MAGRWQISQWPRCEFHVFISHAAEDREKLALPIRDELESAGIAAWIDRHDYPLGTGAHEALRESLLKCRHVIYLVTRAMLKQGRGWIQCERTYSELIQSQLRYRDQELVHFELPLFFVPRDYDLLQRSIWQAIAERGVFCSRGRHAASQVEWATEQIRTFVEQEERRAADIIEGIQTDPDLHRQISVEAHLLRRIAGADLPRLPRYPSEP